MSTWKNKLFICCKKLLYLQPNDILILRKANIFIVKHLIRRNFLFKHVLSIQVRVGP